MLPPERLIAVLYEEHEEDLARLGGFLARAGAARDAAEEGVAERLWHRLPWLALGLVGAMLSAGIVASFEEELQRQVLLAFFVPAVVYMADAVGTQTETVVIRGMALGVSLRSIARRELATGAIIGCLLAVAFFVFAMRCLGRHPRRRGRLDRAARQRLDRDRDRDDAAVPARSGSAVIRRSARGRSRR